MKSALSAGSSRFSLGHSGDLDLGSVKLSTASIRGVTDYTSHCGPGKGGVLWPPNPSETSGIFPIPAVKIVFQDTAKRLLGVRERLPPSYKTLP